MSAVTITIELPPESQALIKNFEKMPQELPQAIKRGMDRSLQVVARRIVQNRLSGKGPYPPTLHQLGEVTGQLRRSVRAEPAVIVGQEVTGAIGTPVIYGAVHEFGFQGTVRYTTRTGKSASRNMNIPERAPFRTGINENTDYISQEIGAEIEKSLDKLSK
jgi:phage gpG-like protein